MKHKLLDMLRAAVVLVLVVAALVSVILGIADGRFEYAVRRPETLTVFSGADK